MRCSALLGLVLLLGAGVAAAEVTLTLERPEPYELQVRGFELTREAEIDIEAIGRWDPDNGGWIQRLFHGGDDEEEMLSVYAWILDAATREPVWVMLGDDTDYVSSTLRKAERSLRLDPGRYELYLYSGYGWLEEYEQRERSRASDRGGEEDKGWWDRLFSEHRFDADDLREDLADCRVTLSVRGLERDNVRNFEVTGDLPGALIRHNRLGDSSFAFSGFELDRPTALRVYALIEQPRRDREPSDYGWIVDADTREIVWQPARQQARAAGGSEKNRLLNETIRLEPGRYIVYAGTDDTHSYDRFNANPPHDPLNWGITLLPGDGFDPAAYRAYSPEQQLPVIEAIRLGNSEFVERPFVLDQDGSVLVKALGEYDEHAEEFADYAWIVDASSGKTVWAMSERNTMAAGGAEKNRLFDGRIELAEGTYILYYVTDGTHAHGDWNSGTPFEAEAWGVRLWADPLAETVAVRPLAAEELGQSADLLVRLVRAGDDERLRRSFTVSQSERVRIYALGEGLSGEMYDYGYIVDKSSGRRIWEMTYDRTDHAGGHDKNRLVDEQLTLEPGSYEAIYVTDDTHSFAGWNGPRPRDPLSWGMTVRLVR